MTFLLIVAALSAGMLAMISGVAYEESKDPSYAYIDLIMLVAALGLAYAAGAAS